MEAVTIAFDPGANVPDAAESVSHVADLLAVQLNVAPPELLRVYVWLTGLKGPPTVPADTKPDNGVIESCAGVATPKLKRSLKSVAFAASPSNGPTLKISSNVRSVELCV